MPVPPELRPTLWRTCRVLANLKRLEMFQFLLDNPSQTVSSLAQQVRVSESNASKSLRMLESRGLLEVRRVGRFVLYSVARNSPAGLSNSLVGALEKSFGRIHGRLEFPFRALTAFTHPRRVQIVRVLSRESATLDELHFVTGISIQALRRHLAKLEKRGFVRRRHRKYSMVRPKIVLAQELSRLASE